jgi:phage-related protein
MNGKKSITRWSVELHDLAAPELLALPADLRARFLRVADMLESFGPHEVGMPHVRPLEGKLWEMRMQGRDGIARAVHVATEGRRLLVLHVFVKEIQTTLRRALETARKCLENAS